MTPNLILAVNAGSSSLKLALFLLDTNNTLDSSEEPEPVSLLATSSLSNIGTSEARLSYSLANLDSSKHQANLPHSVSDHTAAFEHFLQTLFSDADFHYERRNITHVCHRVVHGGSFTDSVVIQKHTYERLEALSDLAPLHNNRALAIIKSCHVSLPHTVSIAFFDSAFHRSLPPHVYTYPISLAVAKEKGLRKYGFHGLSYAFILRSVATYLKKHASQTNIIALHLGSGASACAIRNGESVNVTMGLTPLSGLPGSTRSGDVDPSLIFHYVSNAQNVGRMSHDNARSMHVTEAESILNTEAGWNALTGTTDFHKIATSREASHKLAFDIFIDRICQFIGGYFVQLEGRLDALVFSGGIGENSPELRSAVSQRCTCLGFDTIEETKNQEVSGTGDVVFDIGEGNKPTRTLVCKTNEELEIARQCALKAEYWKSC
ncbi:acetate kinase [Ramaria rubella]|nr:acetate kinase [Ramaria rubella]